MIKKAAHLLYTLPSLAVEVFYDVVWYMCTPVEQTGYAEGMAFQPMQGLIQILPGSIEVEKLEQQYIPTIPTVAAGIYLVTHTLVEVAGGSWGVATFTALIPYLIYLIWNHVVAHSAINLASESRRRLFVEMEKLDVIADKLRSKVGNAPGLYEAMSRAVRSAFDMEYIEQSIDFVIQTRENMESFIPVRRMETLMMSGSERPRIGQS